MRVPATMSDRLPWSPFMAVGVCNYCDTNKRTACMHVILGEGSWEAHVMVMCEECAKNCFDEAVEWVVDEDNVTVSGNLKYGAFTEIK